MYSIIGALVALAIVLYVSVLVSQRVTERVSSKRQQELKASRTQALRRIESELEALEARKSSRTQEDSEAYARLIRRRNLMLA